MTFPTVTRYADLVHAIVEGSFYDNEGIVVPFRSGATNFRLEVGSANAKYGIYVNEIFTGSVMSDSQGNVVFGRVLPLGEVEIAVESDLTKRRVFTYVTVREYAVWLASYAEALELIDTNIIQVSKNTDIETADLDTLQDAHGRHFEFYADIGQSTNAYRAQVKELRTSFRSFGGKFKGLNEAIAEITQVPPIGFSRRKWGPSWRLDQDFASNHRFLNRAHSLTTTATPANVTGVTLVKVEPDVVASAVAHSLDWDSTARTLTWNPSGVAGPATPVMAGELFIPGPANEKAVILSLAETFNIVLNVNDNLYLNFDNVGKLTVPLTTGAARTAAQIVTDILAAFAADARYAAAYGAGNAATYGTKVVLISDVDGGSVKIENGADTAALQIFGAQPGDIKYSPELIYNLAGNNIPGIRVLSLDAVAVPILGDAYVWHQHTAVDDIIRWHAPSVGYGPTISITEDGVYEVVDAGANVITIEVDISALPQAIAITTYDTWTLGWARTKQAPQQTQGLWVTVDLDTLDVANKTDVVQVRDDSTDTYAEFPDNWFADLNDNAEFTSTIFSPSAITPRSAEALDPSTAFKFRIGSTADTSLVMIGTIDKFPAVYQTPRGSNYPQKGDGGIYDYEGFSVIVSGWFRNMDNTAAVDVYLDVSFDGNNSSTSNSVTLAAAATASAYEDMTFLSVEGIIPAEVIVGGAVPVIKDLGALIQVYCQSAGVAVDVEVDSMSATVEYISSRYLSDATVGRDRHHQYFGELMWLWSPEALTLKEQKYLGLQHKQASPASVIGGTGISAISSDTPAGAGTFEYEYTAATSLRRFRWQPFGTAYAPASGWSTITSDGTYTLTAPDTSTIDVDVIYTFLPDTVSSSYPSVTSRAITISDATTNPGLAREISPAHSALEIIDHSAYTSLDVPMNLAGIITEADFSTCGLINSEIQSVDPFKYSYVYPEFLSQTGEELTLALVAANYEATLDYISDEDQTEAILYEDGVPVPNNMWNFKDNNEIQIPQAWFISGDLSLLSTFTLDYDLLYQVETPAIYLGANYLNYAWFVDYFLWNRYDKGQDAYDITEPVFFNVESGRAYLVGRSDMSRSTSELFVQRSDERVIISNRYWRFENDNTISIDTGALIPGNYYLTHKENRVYLDNGLTVTFEHKASSTEGGLTGETYVEVDRNENVSIQADSLDYHQLRLSISGVRNLSDFRIRSLVLKGLRIHGSSPLVTGLTNVWG